MVSRHQMMMRSMLLLLLLEHLVLLQVLQMLMLKSVLAIGPVDVDRVQELERREEVVVFVADTSVLLLHVV